MDLNLWNENFLLASDWGQDLPVDQFNGPFDDLKSSSHQMGDSLLGFLPQDAVEDLHVKDEGFLDMQWMESSDISSYLDALGDDDKLLPLEASLFDIKSSTAPEDPTDKDDLIVKDSTLSRYYMKTEQDSLISETSMSSGFDALLSPPDSPFEVTPVIELVANPCVTFTVEEQKDVPNSNHITLDILSDSIVCSDFTDQGIILGGTNVVEVAEDTCSSMTFDSFRESNSPLSTDDMQSLISLPASPCSSSQSSIIESSPELYKVISTSSIQNSMRYSPYPKPKSSGGASKGKRRARQPAQPVPEHIIDEQLNKKDRKKLQNKNAAIRYRMKKKEEAVGIKSEEETLQEVNTSLKTKVDDLQREIKYMKDLMADVCRAKGIPFSF